jgi:hypothetical protein
MRMTPLLQSIADAVALPGSSQKTPTTLTEACEFNSCPSGSPAVGYNASQPRLNYVNSYPATSMKYGINSIGPQFFNGAPDLAVAGPNVSLKIPREAWKLPKSNVPVLISHPRLETTLAWQRCCPAPLEQLPMLLIMPESQLLHSLELPAPRRHGMLRRPTRITVKSMRTLRST